MCGIAGLVALPDGPRPGEQAARPMAERLRHRGPDERTVWLAPSHSANRACASSNHERLLPYSCKGRGQCPSQNTRRMAEVAAHLTDRVLPWLPVRQWVLSVPKRLRPFLHQTPEVASAVLAIFLRALRSTLEEAKP
jgi:hypothetical protein